MYPYSLLKQDFEIYPIFWNEQKSIHILPMDNDSKWFNSLSNTEIKDQKLFQDKINEIFEKTNSDIIISEYLENREKMFTTLWFEQMINEWRFYHLGLDLSAKCWTSIYSPIDWKVYDIWYEEWDWNYGWYIVLEHNLLWEVFYSIYGHLNSNKFDIKKWDTIVKWTKIWILWDFSQNWWYFYHTHLQVVTELWKEKGFFNKWYCTKEQISDIYKYISDPRFLFKY